MECNPLIRQLGAILYNLSKKIDETVIEKAVNRINEQQTIADSMHNSMKYHRKFNIGVTLIQLLLTSIIILGLIVLD